MTTEHGPHHHDEQTPNDERTRARTYEYGGQLPSGGDPVHAGQPAYAAHSSHTGQATYGTIPPPPPPPLWPDGDGPGGHTAPAHAASGPVGRRKRVVLTAAAGLAAAAVAAGGTAWATAGSSSLTTAQIVSQTDPGVVDVISTLGYQHGTAAGTGMVLTADGEVLTNNHVVAGATAISVRDIGNGRTYTANVIGYSDSDDVAVLKLVGARDLATVKIGDSDRTAVGQNVVALGNADGRDAVPSVATGKITGLGDSVAAQDQGAGTVEHLTGLIRTDADIQPGDSGGPLLNSKGEVIGMDTAASSANGDGFGTTAATTTTAFSIPINRAIAIANQIEAGEASATVHIGGTAFLGVQVAASDGQSGQASSGVPVTGVVPGTAANAAGLGSGDTILSVAGHQVTSGSDLQAVMRGLHPGDKVSLTWSDDLGQSHTARVTLTAGPIG